jgi:Domain of unknown function (DUF4412)
MNRALPGAAFALLPLVALADAELQMVDQANHVDGTYQIKDGKVRMQSSDSGNVSMIYDSATHGMTVIDHDRKSYMHLDVETAAAAGAAMSDAMAEMEKRLAALPPEQREAMKQYMPKLPGGAAPAMPVVTADRTGKSDKVNGKACDLVTVAMDGKALGEACIAPDGLALSAADQQTLHAMFDDMSKMAGSVGGHGARQGQQFAALGGVPLRWTDADNGRVTETRVDNKAAIDASAFEIPAGYSERKIEIPNFKN